MEELKTILKWVFGVICFILGLCSLPTSIAGAILFLVAGLFLIPPIFKKLNKRKKISRATKITFPIASIFVAFIALGIAGVVEVDKTMNKIKEKKNEEYAKLTEEQKDSIVLAERKIDSIRSFNEQKKLDSLRIVQFKEKEKKEIEKLSEELASMKSFDGNKYRGDVSNLTIEVALFITWGKMGEKAKSSQNIKIKKLGQNILNHLKQMQIKEFPKIRSDFSKLIKNKIWENDIEVTNYGKDKSTLQFTGGVFAANKNIKEFHLTLLQRFRDFRFKRINYKWYKYDDEYTYYTIDSEKDSEIKTY